MPECTAGERASAVCTLCARTRPVPVPSVEVAAGSDFQPSGFRPSSVARQSDSSSSVMCSPGNRGGKRWPVSSWNSAQGQSSVSTFRGLILNYPTISFSRDTKKNHLACPMVLSQVLPDLVLDWASKYVGAQGEKSDNALEKTALGFRSKTPHIRATSLTKTK